MAKLKEELAQGLLKACENIKKDAAESLLEQGADIEYKYSMPENTTSKSPYYDHSTPLMVVLSQMCENENKIYEMVKLLLDNNADVNARSLEGNTPLILAADSHYPKVLSLLIQHGADINATNKYGTTPLVNAARNIFSVSIDIIKLLIKSGAKIDGDEGGYTPLMQAANCRDHAVAKILLDNGANPYAKNQFGNTPITLAKKADDKMLSLLLHRFQDFVNNFVAEILRLDSKNDTPMGALSLCDLLEFAEEAGCKTIDSYIELLAPEKGEHNEWKEDAQSLIDHYKKEASELLKEIDEYLTIRASNEESDDLDNIKTKIEQVNFKFFNDFMNSDNVIESFKKLPEALVKELSIIAPKAYEEKIAEVVRLQVAEAEEESSTNNIIDSRASENGVLPDSRAAAEEDFQEMNPMGDCNNDDFGN